MKLAWFTPFSRSSAIARCSLGIVAELAKIAEVDLCHFEAGESREISVPVRRFRTASDVDEQTLSKYDVVVYNFGNHLPFHREIFLLSRRHPGICVLHDFVMHHFFAEYYFNELHDPEAYALLIERVYGDAGRAAVEESLSGGKRVWESDAVAQFPLFEEVIRGALGVVTHSEFFRKCVEDIFPGPVRRIPLAYDAEPTAPVLSRGHLDVEEDEVLIVTVGHVNPNKQVIAVIDALGCLGPIAQRVKYVVLGPCSPDYKRRLEAAIGQMHRKPVVRLLGQVSDESLRSYLSHADVCVNLRYPAFEGASASVIEEMLFGKPVIVTDTGFFAELPDECVLKVRPDRVSELTAALERAITDPGFRERLGKAAQRFARREFRADRYAKEIVDFAWEARSAKPLLGLADQVAIEFNRMGIASDMVIVDNIAQEMRSTFCSMPGSGPSQR